MVTLRCKKGGGDNLQKDFNFNFSGEILFVLLVLGLLVSIRNCEYKRYPMSQIKNHTSRHLSIWCFSKSEQTSLTHILARKCT